MTRILNESKNEWKHDLRLFGIWYLEWDTKDFLDLYQHTSSLIFKWSATFLISECYKEIIKQICLTISFNSFTEKTKTSIKLPWPASGSWSYSKGLLDLDHAETEDIKVVCLCLIKIIWWWWRDEIGLSKEIWVCQVFRGGLYLVLWLVEVCFDCTKVIRVVGCDKWYFIRVWYQGTWFG